MFNGQPGNYTQTNLPFELFNANGQVDYNGTTYNVGNHGNGTRDISIVGSTAQIQSQKQAAQAKSDYQAAIGTAVTGLQTQGTNLDTQYGDLLQKVLGQGTVAMNTVTTGENNLLASRGITNNSPLYSAQMGSAQLPVGVANQSAVSNLGYTQAQLKNTLASTIAGVQSQGAQFAAGIPLSYGSLQLAQAANAANISYLGSQAAGVPTASQALANALAQAQLGYAKPITTGGQIYDPATGAFRIA